jgi:hypothetical protein
MRVRGWLALPAAFLFVLSLLVPSAVLGSVTRIPRADATQATLTVLEESATVISGATGEARVATSGETVQVGDRILTADPGL